jgi:predicted membrane protein
MPPEPRSMTAPRFIIGVFIVLMGLALLLDQLGVVSARHVTRFWPVVLIALGLATLTRGRRRGSVTGLVLIIVGTWLVLNQLGMVFIAPWEFIWPLILVVIGARVMMRRSDDNNYRRPPNPDGPPGDLSAPSSFSTSAPANTSSGGEPSDHVTLFSLMGSSRRRWGRAIFRGAEATCMMGGAELDLRDAVLPADGTAYIDAFILMGGLKIYVPPNWTVVTHIMPIMGGVEDKTRTIPSATLQQLVVHGTAMMGGVEVSN